jgi:hypothetical protein
MSLDIELYTIEETPLDGFIPRIRAIADELSALRDESSDADSAYWKLTIVADELERRQKVTHWERNVSWKEYGGVSPDGVDAAPILSPEAHGIGKASELIPHLDAAIAPLSVTTTNQDRMRTVAFLVAYRDACQRFPDAMVGSMY